MQLEELKKSMSTLEQVLAKTNTDIRIDVPASENAQTKILKKYRQASASAAILAAVFAATGLSGTNPENFPVYIRIFLVSYLAIAALWYLFLYRKLNHISIPQLKPAQLFSKVTAVKLLTLSGEIVFAIGLAVFFTMFMMERLISKPIAVGLFFATLAAALALGIFYFWPKYLSLFRALTSIR